MDREIRIIKREQEQVDQSKVQTQPQTIKKDIITQNSPILKQLKEAEERYKLRKELSVDELIDLDFKEVADKIRAAKRMSENSNNVNSDSDIHKVDAESKDLKSDIPNDQKEVLVKELPINDKSLAYIRDLDEPILPDFDDVKIQLKTSEDSNLRNYNTLHREPIRREALNRFNETSQTKPNVQNNVESALKADSNNIDNSDSMSLIDRLRIDREKIYESKKDQIRKIELNSSLDNKNEIIQDKDYKKDYKLDGELDDNSDFISDVIVPTFPQVDSYLIDQNTNSDKLEYEVDELNCVANHLTLDSIVGSSDYQDINMDNEEKSYCNQQMEVDNLEESLEYKLPHIGLLDEPKYQKVDIDGSEIDLKAHNLISKLRVFRINGDVTDIYSGPVVTTFEFRPAPDVKVSRIQNLENDLSMTLKAKSIRIQAPIPGKDVVGIEIPNNTIQTIYIREIFESPEFVNSDAQLAIALGKDIIGKPIVQDLAKLPHLLIAGTTGSGKSVGLNGMILSLLYRNTPEQLRFIMIDPKRVELSLYKDIPHLLTPIIADPKKAVIALSKAVDEMNRRYELMNEVGVKNIIGYNYEAEQKGFDKLPYIVIIIDEFADLMIMGGKDSEQYLTSLASKARASGIHLIIATQRPTVNVVTGLIKSNLPSRISYRVGSPMDSKVVLDKVGAETLLGNGDMLFSNTNVISRYHAPYSNEKEIERVANYIRSQRSVEYDEFFSLEPKEIIQTAPTNSIPMSEDEYMQKAKEIILSSGRTSASYLQRMLGIGFNRASNILETLEREGFLSAPNSKNIREIIG